ncbi:MAG: hypothetical protein JNM84_21960, partial [Planctomycetes bacterium]|nr:hypothetical protein [Planctomycetota bacterium]
MRNLVLVAGVGLAAALSPRELAAQDPAAPAPIESVRYGRDVRPILSDRCFRCHGPDATQRSGELRLDTREGAIARRDGGAAIAPGAPERSALLARVASDDPDERMPPPESHKRALSKDEIGLLARWIAEG